jgi:hypothetical protein
MYNSVMSRNGTFENVMSNHVMSDGAMSNNLRLQPLPTCESPGRVLSGFMQQILIGLVGLPPLPGYIFPGWILEYILYHWILEFKL